MADLPSLMGPSHSDDHGTIFDGAGFNDPALRNLYTRSKGLIAFIDESYRAPAQAVGGNSFYILTSVLMPRPTVAAVRAKLLAIAGARTWHTSGEARNQSGRDRILKMSRYLARSSAAVIAVHGRISPADKDAEEARSACFDALLGGLCRTNQLEPAGLAVIEQRRDTTQRRIDHRTIRNLRATKRIHETLFVHHGSPAHETLLWAPDIVAWCVRQRHAVDDPTFIEPLINGRYREIKAG